MTHKKIIINYPIFILGSRKITNDNKLSWGSCPRQPNCGYLKPN